MSSISLYIEVLLVIIVTMVYILVNKFDLMNLGCSSNRRIVDSLGDCLIVLDGSFKVKKLNRTFNDSFKDILPIREGDNFIESIKLCNTIKINPELLKSALSNNILRRSSMPFNVNVTENGLDKWFSIEITRIENRKKPCSVISIRDITCQKRHQMIEIERAKLLGFVQISGDLAHDINTPLSTARNCASDIYEIFDRLRPINIMEQYDYLRSVSLAVLNGCERSLRIANKLRHQLNCIYNEERTEFNLKEVISDVIVGEYDLHILMKQLNCSYKIYGQSNIQILSYKDNLCRVLKNIIKNAVESYREKYVDDDKIVEITLSKETNESNQDVAVIAVRDYGSGIKEKLQDDILRRPLKTKNLKTDGGGVSLFFAYVIVVAQLEGEIWFESKEGEGSIFFVSIPLICDEREYEKIN